MAGPIRGEDRGGPPAWQGPGRAGPWDEAPPQRQPYSPVQQYPAEEESSSTRLVRPYTVTGGRTQPRYKLALEALVTATVYEPRDLSVLAPECQAILQFCWTGGPSPRSRRSCGCPSAWRGFWSQT